MPTYQHTCKVCSVKFETNRKNSRTCSKQCRTHRVTQTNRKTAVQKANEKWLAREYKERPKQKRQFAILERSPEWKMTFENDAWL